MLWGHLFKDLIKTTYDMIKRRNFSNGKDYLEDSNSTNSDSPEDVKIDVLIIRRDNENYDIRFGNNITSGGIDILNQVSKEYGFAILS